MTAARREYKVEDHLQAKMKSVDGACEKHTNPGHRGDPDRLCSFICGYHCLVETKWADDAPLPAYQARRHEWWRQHGMDVFVLKSKEQVDEWWRLMRQRGNYFKVIKLT